MIENSENNKSIHARHQGLWCAGSRGGGIFCGLFLLVLGLIWIGKKTGLIPLDMALFWPSIMMIIGIWIMAGAILRRKRS